MFVIVLCWDQVEYTAPRFYSNLSSPNLNPWHHPCLNPLPYKRIKPGHRIVHLTRYMGQCVHEALSNVLMYSTSCPNLTQAQVVHNMTLELAYVTSTLD